MATEVIEDENLVVVVDKGKPWQIYVVVSKGKFQMFGRTMEYRGKACTHMGWIDSDYYWENQEYIDSRCEWNDEYIHVPCFMRKHMKPGTRMFVKHHPL